MDFISRLRYNIGEILYKEVVFMSMISFSMFGIIFLSIILSVLVGVILLAVFIISYTSKSKKLKYKILHHESLQTLYSKKRKSPKRAKLWAKP